MFSNKFYRWKLGGAIVLIAGLGVYSNRRGDSINPELWRCIAEPERWEGKGLWIQNARIVSVGDSDFEIGTGVPEIRIRVQGRAPGVPGDRITLGGIFRSAGPRFEMARARIVPAHFQLRWLVEAVSVAVVLALLANFARHFLFRPKILQFEKGG